MLERLQRMSNFESQDFDAVVRTSCLLAFSPSRHTFQIVAPFAGE